MKKIFYILTAAIVALGAVACDNQNLDNATPAGEGLTITASLEDIDRVAVDENNFTAAWDDNDQITIWHWDEATSKELSFTFKQESTGVFKCNDENTEILIGKYCYAFCGEFDSTKGLKGVEFGANGRISATGTELHFIPQQALLVVEAEGENITLKASENIFMINGSFANEVTLANGKNFVSCVSNSATITYYIGGEKGKSLSKTIESGKVYTLGTIAPAPVAMENWGIVGGHQGWNAENPDPLYLIPGSNTYVSRNVKLNAEGFKFYGSYSKMITVEHPAVTTGEQGDYFLVPNSNWKQSNARFAIYFFNNSTGKNTWVSMQDSNKDGIYAANKPNDGNTYTHMIFCRMNPGATANNWNNKWNQTGDLTCPTNGNNCFTVPSGSWDGATTKWSVHTPEVKDAWTEEVEEITTYWIGKDSADNISNWVTRWSNNVGGDNITVDTSKTYDIYFHKGDDQDWGFEVHYTVLESGSAAPVLK